MSESSQSIKQKVQQQFGQHAQKYVTSSTHAKGSDLVLLKDWLEVNFSSVVLDIATGGGHAVKSLAPYVAQVFATDLTYQMLETAKRHLDSYATNIFYVVADAESLPFLENTFDAITCRIAAHHFPNPHLFVKEVSRVLKPGGKFVLIDNIAPEDKDLDHFVNKLEKLRDDSHVRSYSVSEWTRWFEQANLSLVKADHRKKVFHYPDWVRRTTNSEEQVKTVDAHLLSASKPIQEYFSIETLDGSLQSITIDEWMVLVEKR